MRKLVGALLLGYIVVALYYRAKEGAGLMRCDCYPDCWCKKPGLSLFRWVFPRSHRNPAHEAWKKRQLGEST